jgi:hypothetical protein
VPKKKRIFRNSCGSLSFETAFDPFSNFELLFSNQKHVVAARKIYKIRGLKPVARMFCWRRLFSS